MKGESRENLKYCGHCWVLNGSNATAPQLLSPRSLSTSPLFLSHYSHHHWNSPLCALCRSQCSHAAGRLKERCSPTDSTTDSIPLPVLMLQHGLWENVKKSCNNETTVAWIRKLTVWNSWCILDSVMIWVWSGEAAEWFEREMSLLFRKMANFLFLPLVWVLGSRRRGKGELY